jgi:LuxR family maltose regulon positive regulatory protein
VVRVISPFYLRSKVTRPRPSGSAIPRDHLVQRLIAGNAPVWLLSAPAGYGKTTVVLQALEQVGTRVSWIALDSADNDPMRFWAHFAAAVAPDEAAAGALVEEIDPKALDEAADLIIAEIERQPEPLVVVLDDLHEIHDESLLEDLGRLMTLPPENLTLVITARSDPALPIGRLRAHGRIAELRSSDLAFSQDEVRLLLAGGSDEVTDSAVLEALERTAGWPTALAMLATSAGPDRGVAQLLVDSEDGQSDLADFLAGEVLSRQSPELQDFLVQTSVLDHMEPSLCDRITGKPGSLGQLHDLTRRHVFCQIVDADAKVFRYHPLFREFLLLAAQELPDDQLSAIHCSAARWYEDNDDPSRAIRHALDAADTEFALKTIKLNYLPFSQMGLLATVDDWLTAYGRDRCRLDPELRMAAAWVALNARSYEEVDSWLEAPSGSVDSDSTRVEIHTIRSHRARHLGHQADAVAEARLALDHAEGTTPGVQSIAHAVLGMSLVLGGEDGNEDLVAAIREGQAVGNDSSIVIGYSYLALAAANDPERMDEADALADQALDYVDSPILERFHQPSAAHLVKSQWAMSKGRVADASEAADRALGIAQEGWEPLLVALVSCQSALVAHRRGDSGRARTLLRSAEAAAGQHCGSWITRRISQTRNMVRFAAVDGDVLLPGAVELTAKESEVLALLPHRLSRRDLAEQLFVSENTLKTHLSSIRSKLGAERGDDLVGKARTLGLISDDSAEG